MQEQEKIDELKFAIGRFDHYYDSVNNKSNLYLAVNTFILGSVIAGFATLNEKLNFPWWIQMLFALALLLNLFAISYTLAAINPFLKRKNGVKSMIFFGDVDASSEVTVTSYWNNLEKHKYKDDLMTQYKILSGGLTQKFKWLAKATIFVILQVAVIVIFGIIYLFIF